MEREIKKNIEYALLISEKDRLQWDGIIEIMADACMNPKGITLGGVKLDKNGVYEKLMKVDDT